MKNGNKGFTVAELIIFLALLGIVLSVGFTLFSAGQSSFKIGSEKYQLQSDIRLASEFINDEVRNAVEIDVVTLPFTEQAGYSYIYLQDSKIKHLFNGTTTEKTQAIMVDQTIFSIILDANNKNLLRIALKGMISGKEYLVNTDVFLNNISSKAASSGKAIKYKKP